MFDRMYNDQEVDKYLTKMLNEFEDFQWTDTNSGEPNTDFEEKYGKFVDYMREKYLTNRE